MRPDWASCPGCDVTHVVLDAGLLPRRAYAAELFGQALSAAALGSGHRRIARDLAVPADTVRGWIRGTRRSVAQLRITGIRTVVAFDQDALPAQVRPDEVFRLTSAAGSPRPRRHADPGRGRELPEVLRSRCRSSAWLTGRGQTANLTLTLGEAAQSREPGIGPARGSRPWT